MPENVALSHGSPFGLSDDARAAEKGRKTGRDSAELTGASAGASRLGCTLRPISRQSNSLDVMALAPVVALLSTERDRRAS